MKKIGFILLSILWDCSILISKHTTMANFDKTTDENGQQWMELCGKLHPCRTLKEPHELFTDGKESVWKRFAKNTPRKPGQAKLKRETSSYVNQTPKPMIRRYAARQTPLEFLQSLRLFLMSLFVRKKYIMHHHL
jgi:hypothetical protein